MVLLGRSEAARVAVPLLLRLRLGLLLGWLLIPLHDGLVSRLVRGLWVLLRLMVVHLRWVVAGARVVLLMRLGLERLLIGLLRGRIVVHAALLWMSTILRLVIVGVLRRAGAVLRCLHLLLVRILGGVALRRLRRRVVLLVVLLLSSNRILIGVSISIIVLLSRTRTCTSEPVHDGLSRLPAKERICSISCTVPEQVRSILAALLPLIALSNAREWCRRR